MNPVFGMNGKGCAGSIAWGSQQREDLFAEMLVKPGFHLVVQAFEADHADADLRERLLELGEHRQLTADQLVGFLIDRLELLRRR